MLKQLVRFLSTSLLSLSAFDSCMVWCDEFDPFYELCMWISWPARSVTS